MWVVLSLCSAFLAAVTATLTKAGVKTVDSSVGMAIQSVVILVCSWSVVAFQRNLGAVPRVDRRELMFLLLAGVASAAAYLFMFRALKMGDASRVTPLDRLSLVFAILIAALFLKEKITMQVALGAGLMAVGAIMIASSR